MSAESPAAPAASDPDALSLSRRLARRNRLYAACAVGLVALALIVARSTWSSSGELHTEMEIVAALLAGAVGTLSLVRYYSQRHNAYLFVGAGFVATSILDAQHALVTSAWLADEMPSDYSNLTVWSWTISRLFLATMILLAWFGWRRQASGWSDENIRPRRLYAAMGVVLVGSMLLLFLVPVPASIFPEFPLHRPLAIFPALLFLAGFLAHYRKQWVKVNGFDFWLMLSLVFGIATEAVFMPFSAAPFDALFDTAHVLKICSYIFVFVGLVVSVFSAYRRLESAISDHRKLNAVLAKEVESRRDAQMTLAESQSRLQDILDNATDLIQSIGADGRFEYVNRAWLRTLEYSSDEVPDLTIMDIIAPESREHCMTVFQQVMAGKPIEGVEAVFVSKSGNRIEVSGSANSRGRAGEPASTRSIFRNVTEPRRAERERERFFNLSADMFCIAGTDGFLKRVNPAFERVLGYSQEELLARPFLDFVCEEDHAATQLELAALTDGRPMHHFENRYQTNSGELRRLSWSASPAEDGLVYAVARDITELAETRNELLAAKNAADAANRAKSEFLANMSHELRTPLNSVLGLTSVMLLQDDLEDEPRTLLERVSANGKHLLELINDLLDLTKIEAGHVDLNVEAVDLGALIEAVSTQIAPLARAKSLDLRTVLAPGARTLRTDEGRLRQVLINLVGNAVKFTRDGCVVVRLVADEESGEPLAVVVEDTGIGIAEDRLGEVFNPFTQAESSMNRRFGGTGLGLSISRSLCSVLGFGLSVESSLGAGSVFTIDLAGAVGDPHPALAADTAAWLDSWRDGTTAEKPGQ